MVRGGGGDQDQLYPLKQKHKKMRPTAVARFKANVSRADRFTSGFLHWLDSNDIAGPIDLDRLFVLSHEFADFDNCKPISQMSLTKALSRHRIKKWMRDRKPNEPAYTKARLRNISRPRTTVYLIPSSKAVLPSSEMAQSDLFENSEVSSADAASERGTPASRSLSHLLRYWQKACQR